MSQVRKSAKQLQAERQSIRLEILCGLLPHQIMEKHKLTSRELSSYMNQLKADAAKRFQQLDVDYLAFQSELYIETHIRLRIACDMMIARACADKVEEDIVEPEFIRIARDLNNDIINHQAEMVKAVTAFKTYESMKKQAAVTEKEGKEGISLGKDNPNSHMGVS